MSEAAAAQLAMDAQQRKAGAIQNIIGLMQDKRASNIAKRLTQWDDLSESGIRTFAEQSGLDLSKESDAKILNSALETREKFYDFARKRTTDEQGDTLFGFNKSLLQNQVDRLPTENAQADERFNWEKIAAENEKTLFDYDYSRRPTADAITDEANRALANQRNATADYYNTEKGSALTATELKQQQAVEAQKLQDNAYNLLADASEFLSDDKGRQMGMLDIGEDGLTMSGVVPTKSLQSISERAARYGYRVVRGGSEDIDVPGRWGDEKGTIVRLVPVSSVQQQTTEQTQEQPKTDYQGLLERAKGGDDTQENKFSNAGSRIMELANQAAPTANTRQPSLIEIGATKPGGLYEQLKRSIESQGQ